jgi:cyanophycin synthetase
MSWITAVGAIGGAPGDALRSLAAGFDLIRSTGVRYGLQRLREQRAWEGVPVLARDEAYNAIWTEAGDELGIRVRALEGGIFEFTRGETRLDFRRDRPPVEDESAWDAAGDKERQRALLETAGITVPAHLQFDAAGVAAAHEFLDRTGGACVIKPAVDTGAGTGVTSGIRAHEDLARAVLRASRAGPGLLIEEQAEGDEYRILVLDGEVLDIVRRQRPAVTGDGRSSVGELIAAENRRRLAGDALDRLRMLTADLDAVLALRRQGLEVRSRPAAGERVEVKSVVNRNSVAENATVREPLSAPLCEYLATAVRTSGLRLAGIDLITADLDGPPREGVILEVNPHPGLHHHYAVADRRSATRVAVPILRALMDDREMSREEGNRFQ